MPVDGILILAALNLGSWLNLRNLNHKGHEVPRRKSLRLKTFGSSVVHRFFCFCSILKLGHYRIWARPAFEEQFEFNRIATARAAPARFRDYAEAASRLCSATADSEPDTGLRIGRTSA